MRFETQLETLVFRSQFLKQVRGQQTRPLARLIESEAACSPGRPGAFHAVPSTSGRKQAKQKSEGEKTKNLIVSIVLVEALLSQYARHPLVHAETDEQAVPRPPIHVKIVEPKRNRAPPRHMHMHMQDLDSIESTNSQPCAVDRHSEDVCCVRGKVWLGRIPLKRKNHPLALGMAGQRSTSGELSCSISRQSTWSFW